MRLNDLKRGLRAGSEQAIPCRFAGLRQSRANGEMLWEVLLEDSSGCISAALTPTSLQATNLVRDEPVIIAVDSHPTLDQSPPLVASLKRFTPRLSSEAVALLPRCRTPEPSRPALDWLRMFAGQLSNAPLDGFVTRIMSDPAIGLPLLRARASFKHHHASFGGLLRHTVEVMRTVGGLARYKLPSDSRIQLLCQVGGLIHDLGKVVTHGEFSMPKPRMPRHEILTGQLVRQHLQWLSQHDAEAGEHLRTVMEQGAIPYPQRKRSWSIVAELVALADQNSAIFLGELHRRELYAKPAANDAISVPAQKHSRSVKTGHPE